MTKTDLSYKTAVHLRSAGDPSPAIDDLKNYVGDVWLCFRLNFFQKKKLSMAGDGSPADRRSPAGLYDRFVFVIKFSKIIPRT